MTHWKERLDLVADTIAIGGLVLGTIKLMRVQENPERFRDALRSRIESHRTYRELERYTALKDTEHLHNSAPARFGRMALWNGLGIAGLVSGLLARTSHASGHPAEVVSGILMLFCLFACGGTIVDALITGYRLYDYENYRYRTIEKIRRVAPELVGTIGVEPVASFGRRSDAGRAYVARSTGRAT